MTNKKNVLVTLGLIIVAILGFAFFTQPGKVIKLGGNLSADEINGLVQMREEEKLARDVYQTLGQKWNVKVFSNITGSEQIHISRVKVLLDKYNIPDPVTDDTVGAFTNPAMKKLYDELTTQGAVSLEEALKVGVIIEEMDIKDLDQEIAKTGNSDIINVYQNLKRGSENHLRAFSSNLKI
jgi:hypothetical protein